MPAINFVKKKIGDSYLIWFQNTNLFFYLEEPAWFVFKKVVKRCKTETIANEFSIRYSMQHDKSLSFVKEIRFKIDEMNKPQKNINLLKCIENDIINHIFNSYSTHYYKINNKEIKFSFEFNWLENFIHQLIAHLKITKKSKIDSHFELFTFNHNIVLRIDGEIKGIWDEDESEYVKGRIFIELLNKIHDKTETDWLMTVHASAISNGKKTMLFSAAPGSGKTTFAALLRANGYYLISDDFVPIEQSTFCAYPLPIAMSVKEGSLNLLKPNYPNLEKSPVITINENKKVRYIPSDNGIIEMKFPVKEILYIKYDQNIEFKLEKIQPVEALKQLLQEAWIPASSSNIEVFLDKILNVSFYSLTYSNFSKALNAINLLFENE